MIFLLTVIVITTAVLFYKFEVLSQGALTAAIADRIRSGGQLNKQLTNEQIKAALKDPQVLDLINQRIIDGHRD